MRAFPPILLSILRYFIFAVLTVLQYSAHTFVVHISPPTKVAFIQVDLYTAGKL